MRGVGLASRKLCVFVTSMLVLGGLGIVTVIPVDSEDMQLASALASTTKDWPDLIVSDILWVNAYGGVFTSGSVTAGQPFETKVAVRNIGLGVATQSFQVSLYVDDSLAESALVDGLAAGSSYTVSWGSMFCTGQTSHSFRAFVDSDNQILEKAKGTSAEANNERIEYLTTQLAEWTVAFYLAGDNNLEQYMIDDFLALASIGSSASLSLVALVDRIPGYDWRYYDWTDTYAYFVTPDLLPTPQSALEAGEEKNLGDPQTLVDFGTMAFSRFGAAKRFLILDDHGSLTTGVCEDDTSEGDRLTVPEQALAIKSISHIIGDTIDVVGYDACLMGFSEVFYESLGAVDYIIGSEYIGLPPGWPYEEIFSTLRSNPTMTPRTLVALVVQEYEERWGQPGVFTDDQHTLVAIDCSELADLVSAMGDFAYVLYSNLPDWGPELSIVRWDKVVEPALWYLYTDWSIDLYNLAYEVKLTLPDSEVQASAQAVMDAISAALVDYTIGTGYDTIYMRGLGVMFPMERDFLLTDGWNAYWTMSFPRDTFWHSFLLAFHSRPSRPQSLAVEADDDSIALSWSPPSYTGGYTITNYHIYRGTVSGQLTRIASTGTGSICAWTDAGVTRGVKYYYRVAAANEMGTGDYSSEVSAVAGTAYLTIVTDEGCPTPEEGVYPYQLGSTATVSTVASYYILGVKWLFYGWYLDGQIQSFSTTVDVLMSTDHTLYAAFYPEWAAR